MQVNHFIGKQERGIQNTDYMIWVLMTNNNGPSSLYPTCPICTLRLFCIPRLYPVSTQLVKAILNSKDFQNNIDAKQTPPKLVKSVLVGG